MGRDDIIKPMAAFKKTIDSLQRACVEFNSQVPAATKPQTSVLAGAVAAIVKNAHELYKEKATPIVAAMISSANRVKSRLQECLVDWRSFAVETEDVQRIKTELIKNPSAPLVLPILKSLETAVNYLRENLAGCGASTEQLDAIAGLQETLSDGAQQLGASAICVAIYVTASSSAKASTKLKNMAQAKSLLSSLDIKLPLPMLGRLQSKIEELTTMAKSEAKKNQ